MLTRMDKGALFEGEQDGMDELKALSRQKQYKEGEEGEE
jgi:hypothetical protein